jgi:hypothetical protein
MTTHLTKIWWDLNKHKLVEPAIPEAEIYNREWVGLTKTEFEEAVYGLDDLRDCWHAIEAKLKEKNCPSAD